VKRHHAALVTTLKRDCNTGETDILARNPLAGLTVGFVKEWSDSSQPRFMRMQPKSRAEIVDERVCATHKRAFQALAP